MSAAPLTLSQLSFTEVASIEAGSTSLLVQARQGNREAFAQMVSPYMPTVYQRARRLTGNTADAEDVSQEALLKAWSRLGQFSGQQDENSDDFRAWLARIAGNTSIDVLRQRRDGKILSMEEQRGLGEETLGGSIPAREDNPEERCARRERCRLLADAIKQLPADLRQACLLRDVLQYSSQEVADRLGISVVAVRLRLFRAHRRLRETLHQATQPKARAERTATVIRARNASPEQRRRDFIPLHAAAGFACGD
jgi:RNA polymerase sigma-70 factor, ECF subfamily